MPQILVKGIEAKKVQTIVNPMIDELAPIINFPKDYFSIECVDRVMLKYEVGVVEDMPFVEVTYFNKDLTIEDGFAKVITKYIQSLGYENVDIIFNIMSEAKYYSNGEHYE